MAKTTTDLREAVIEFYRDELRKRYSYSNVKRFAPFEGIPKEHIQDLRDYFLQHIYPPADNRQQLDDAFDRLADMFRSPARMRPLLGTALTSLWRLGRQIPAAVSAGMNTLDAYRETRKLEGLMIAEAEQIGIDESDFGKRERMLQVIAAVPEREVARLIEDVVRLFRSMTNRKLLDATVQIMHLSQDTIEKRPDIYSESERRGLALGLGIIEGGRDLFVEIGEEAFPRIADGIREVEYDWFARVKGQTGVSAG